MPRSATRSSTHGSPPTTTRSTVTVTSPPGSEYLIALETRLPTRSSSSPASARTSSGVVGTSSRTSTSEPTASARERADHVGDERTEVDVDQVQRPVRAVDLRQREQVLEHRADPAGRALDAPQHRLARVARRQVVEQHLEVAEDRRDRVLELVGEHVDELAAVVGGRLRAAQAVLELLPLQQRDDRPARLPGVHLEDPALLARRAAARSWARRPRARRAARRRRPPAARPAGRAGATRRGRPGAGSRGRRRTRRGGRTRRRAGRTSAAPSPRPSPAPRAGSRPAAAARRARRAPRRRRTARPCAAGPRARC